MMKQGQGHTQHQIAYSIQRMAKASERREKATTQAEKDQADAWIAAWGQISGMALTFDD